MPTADPIRFSNGLELDILREGERFLGIGRVRCDGRDLRSDALPWSVHAESDSGTSFDDWMLTGIHRDGDAVSILACARGRWMPRSSAGDAMGDDRIRVRRKEQGSAILRWTFRPIEERIADEVWHGLAMQVGIDCPGSPIGWLIEDATWEIGGDAAGCTLIQRDASGISLEQATDRGSAYSTAELFRKADGTRIVPMDMMPRCAGASHFDFQWKGGTALCLFAERPSLTRARIDKLADEALIHYTERPFFPLTERASAPERKLLVFTRDRPLARHEARNLWLDCHAEIRDRILATYGVTAEEPVPIVWAHLWDDELKRRGPSWTAPLIAAMPEYGRLGFSQVMTFGVWESVTSDPQRTRADGSICCPYELRFAEGFGGTAGMRAVVDAAHREGVEVLQWVGFHCSRHAPVWKEHPDWILREPDGDPYDASYHCLWAGRLRSPYGAWMRERLRAIREDTGMDGLFLDSYQNLGVTAVDWGAPDQAPQAEEIFRLQGDLQRQGYRCQRPEIVTIFGVSNVAMFGFDEQEIHRRPWRELVDGDQAFALIDIAPAFFSRGVSPYRADRCSPERYRWLAAHRCVPPMGGDPWAEDGTGLPGGELAEAYGRVNRAYRAALPHMRRLRLVADGGHVLWLDAAGEPAVVWTFASPAIISFAGPWRDLDGARGEAGGDLEIPAGRTVLLGTAACLPSADEPKMAGINTGSR